MVTGRQLSAVGQLRLVLQRAGQVVAQICGVGIKACDEPVVERQFIEPP